jgi:hypothetical protein
LNQVKTLGHPRAYLAWECRWSANRNRTNIAMLPVVCCSQQWRPSKLPHCQWISGRPTCLSSGHTGHDQGFSQQPYTQILYQTSCFPHCNRTSWGIKRKKYRPSRTLHRPLTGFSYHPSARAFSEDRIQLKAALSVSMYWFIHPTRWGRVAVTSFQPLQVALMHASRSWLDNWQYAGL